jgi:hypothetical protein
MTPKCPDGKKFVNHLNVGDPRSPRHGGLGPIFLGLGVGGSDPRQRFLLERKRPEGKEQVGFWRAMEVLGLWAAAGIGLVAIITSPPARGSRRGWRPSRVGYVSVAPLRLPFTPFTFP